MNHGNSVKIELTTMTSDLVSQVIYAVISLPVHIF